MEDEEIQIYYPFWTKLLVVTVLPLLLWACLWMIARPILEPELKTMQLAASVLIGLFVSYQCMIGIRCLPYLNTKLALDDEGVDVTGKGQTTKYSWDDLTVNEYSFATTTQIKNKKGETVAYLSDSLPNLQLLKSLIKNDCD